MRKEDIVYLTVGSLFVIAIIITIYNSFNMDLSKTTHKTTQKVEKEMVVKKDTRDKVNNSSTDDDYLINEISSKENNESNLKSKAVTDKTKIDSNDSEKDSEKKEEDGIPAKFIAENHLPPYPGKDGGPGVYGTDVNHNNIRDDMEREIAWVFRNNPEVRDIYYANAVSQKLDMDLAVKKDYSPESNREMDKRQWAVLDCKYYYLYKKYSGLKTLSEEQLNYDNSRMYNHASKEKWNMISSYDSGVLKSESFAGSMEELKAFKNRGRKSGEMDGNQESNYRDQHPEMMEEFCKNLVSDLLNK